MMASQVLVLLVITLHDTADVLEMANHIPTCLLGRLRGLYFVSRPTSISSKCQRISHSYCVQALIYRSLYWFIYRRSGTLG